MKVKQLFLLSLSLMGAVTAMERPASPDREQVRALDATDLFAQFEKVRIAIIGKAKAQGLQIPDTSFANYFATIFTKAIQQASTAQLSNSERENLGKCITSYLSLDSLDKKINAVKQNKNLITVITKIIGDKTAQAAVLAQAFKMVDQKYATQEEIEQIIANAIGQQNNSASTTTATSTTAKPQRVKFYWEDSSDDDDLDVESFELAWKLQQEQMLESKQEPQGKPGSNSFMTNEDKELAKAVALSEQTMVQPVKPSVSIAEDEAYARALALSEQKREQAPVLSVQEDEELQLAMAISKEETKQLTHSAVDPDLERVLSMSQKQEVSITTRKSSTKPSVNASTSTQQNSEEADIRRAMQMSLQQATPAISNTKESTKKEIIQPGRNTDCPICLADFEPKDELAKASGRCNHVMHKACYAEFNKKRSYAPEESNPNYVVKLGCPICGAGKEDNSTSKK